MKLIITVVIFCFFVFSSACAEDSKIYVTGKSIKDKETDERYSELPPYLRYPNDAISELMFGDDMKEVANNACNYRFMLYTVIADLTPEIEYQSSPFGRDETHYYFKDGQAAWYSVSIMNNEYVHTSNLRDLVENQFALMIDYDNILRIPQHMRGKTFRDIAMYYIGQNDLYNQLHGFDESHVYCRVFYLGEQLYKKFILIAKKDDWAWRIEENITSHSEQIEPPDFVPAGQTFGKFYPFYKGENDV